ncbi:type I restriction enzyme, S subunit [Desulfonatronum thiosulfatophilum]|uniref:Type I restriction enzyme, S subunit n=1 Tax=Desulfonatronum thiosulfatophilum TaxID=617002 RepID=A0A1G6EUU8_9BACT|nr:restriction endonuclease subunit S [Desulfonatronum thiosulfatophilum]SDB60595.1 type I restriction enzyme, S subunit [Desulfonatronum thiosulfatophilum]
MSEKTVWPMIPLGNLLKQVRRPVSVKKDAIYREIGIRSHCKGIFHKPETTGEKIGEKRVFWIEPDCLVLNIVFAWEQAVAMTSNTEAGMIASHRFPMYCSRNGKLLPEYAWRYFTTPRGKYDLNVASPGGAGRNKTLGQEEFKQLKIPVPPLEYQRKAVSVLSTADQAIASLEKLISAKRTLKKGLAQQLLTGLRRLPGFSKPWGMQRLGNLVTLHFSGIDKKTHADEVPVRLCNYTDVFYNDRITSDMSFMQATASKSEIENFSLKQWDVIITKDSETPDDIGKPAVVMQDMSGVVCGYHLAILRPMAVDGSFLAQLLRLTRTRYELYRIANGVTRFGLGQSSLRHLDLSVPDQSEQTCIAAVLGTADREIALLEKKHAALRELKKGLMQKLLTGSVNQKAEVDSGL